MLALLQKNEADLNGRHYRKRARGSRVFDDLDVEQFLGRVTPPTAVAQLRRQLPTAESRPKLFEDHTEHFVVAACEEHRECDLNYGTLA